MVKMASMSYLNEIFLMIVKHLYLTGNFIKIKNRQNIGPRNTVSNSVTLKVINGHT